MSNWQIDQGDYLRTNISTSFSKACGGQIDW